MRHRPDPFLFLAGKARPPSLLGRVLASVAAVGILVLAFTVSVFVLAGALVVGALAWAWLMWKTRVLRRDLRAQMEAAQRGEARGVTIIEGEVIREEPRER
ncbi:MAG: hypothetical protein AB7I32_03700 [Gammaproteobacteria bacterium]